MKNGLVLVFDTETTGLVDLKLPDDHPKQPHLVQLACSLIDSEGNSIQRLSLIVKPDGWKIPKQAADVHGITTEYATALGIPLRVVVATYTNLRAVAQALAAHNAEFDIKVMACAMAQIGAKPTHPGPERIICTKEESSALVNLPPTERMIAAGYGGKPKAPTLTELHTFLFGEGFDGAHDALVDVEACSRCLMELRREHSLCLI